MEKINNVGFYIFFVEFFTYPWELRKLNEIFSSVESGNRLPKDKIISGDCPYVIAQTTNNGIYEYIDIKTLDFHGNPMKLFKGPSISFSIDNPNAIFIQKDKFFTSNIMRVLHNENLNEDHYHFFLELLRLQTSSFNWAFKFSGPIVLNLVLMMPKSNDCLINYYEIKTIGSFFCYLDKLITLHQCEPILKSNLIQIIIS